MAKVNEPAFSAHIGEPMSKLIGEGANQSIATVRTIEILQDGKVIRSLESADSETDIHGKISAAGFTPGVRVGDQIELKRGPINPAQKIFLGCLGLIGLAMVLIIGGCTIGMATGGGADEPTAADAKYFCEEFAKDKLKSPSTAKFSAQTASGSGASWTSGGVVDSQNGFGAMVRSTYSCTLSYSSSDESWSGSAVVR